MKPIIKANRLISPLIYTKLQLTAILLVINAILFTDRTIYCLDSKQAVIEYHDVPATSSPVTVAAKDLAKDTLLKISTPDGTVSNLTEILTGDNRAADKDDKEALDTCACSNQKAPSRVEESSPEAPDQKKVSKQKNKNLKKYRVVTIALPDETVDDELPVVESAVQDSKSEEVEQVTEVESKAPEVPKDAIDSEQSKEDVKPAKQDKPLSNKKAKQTKNTDKKRNKRQAEDKKDKSNKARKEKGKEGGKKKNKGSKNRK